MVVQNVAEADPRGFDLIVIGSPIYEEHPLPSVVNFLVANRDRLSDKDVALFVVCVDYGTAPKEELVHRRGRLASACCRACSSNRGVWRASRR